MWLKPPGRSPYALEPGYPSPGAAYPSPSPLISTSSKWYRNINLFAIDYASRPRLRPRLTPGGLALPGNPWVFGDRVSHPVYRYSCQHNLLENLQSSFRSVFDGNSNAPLPTLQPKVAAFRGFGDVLEPRYILGAKSRWTSELLRFL